MNVVIMAGGGGTRLWPVSREKFPKQFTQLFGQRTLLQHAFARARAVVRSVDHIVVTTRAPYFSEVRRQLRGMPPDNILVEPVKRDTAPSIGMAAAFLAARGRHDEPMVLLPADHFVRNTRLFDRALRAMGALLTSHPDMTVLLGSRPTYPETGYGYIELGPVRLRRSGLAVRSVRRFREKPTLPLAKRFLHSGRFVWNMGVYGWRVATLQHLLHAFAPDIARTLDRMETLFRSQRGGAARTRLYRTLRSISIDFAVTDHQDPATITVLPGDYGWSDVGHWAALEELLAGREGVETRNGTVVHVHGSGNFVYNASTLAIGLAGVTDTIVVATPDALLVCDKAHVQDVKKLVEEFARKGHRKFL